MQASLCSGQSGRHYVHGDICIYGVLIFNRRALRKRAARRSPIVGTRTPSKITPVQADRAAILIHVTGSFDNKASARLTFKSAIAKFFKAMWQCHRIDVFAMRLRTPVKATSDGPRLINTAFAKENQR